MTLHGLSAINVELTSRCNKGCWCCGRRYVDRSHPEVLKTYGDMPLGMASRIAEQLPPGIIVQLHNNGEPLLYPYFSDAVRMFSAQVTGIDTNGKLLVDKSNAIVDNLDTITISVIQDDPEADEQREIIKRFLRIKGKYKPLVVLRLNGNVDRMGYAKDFPDVVIATRNLHSPMGSFDYTRKVTVPEMGICLEALHRLSINRFGRVSMCVRFDPTELGFIGDINGQTLDEIWNGEVRTRWLEFHKRGDRRAIALCSKCEYWGVPTGW
jgi:hypothetical protein